MAFPTNPVEKQTFNGYIFENGLWRYFQKPGSNASITVEEIAS